MARLYNITFNVLRAFLVLESSVEGGGEGRSRRAKIDRASNQGRLQVTGGSAERVGELLK